MPLVAKQSRQMARRQVEALGNALATDGAMKVLLYVDADAVKQVDPARPLPSASVNS